MNRIKYQDGQKFGNITLLNRVSSKAAKPRGLFLCYCGIEFETRIDAIVGGSTKSCGCSRGEAKKIIYEIGEKIGTCFYMGDAVYKHEEDRRATFKCHCGNYFISLIRSIKNGNTKSCGCSTNKYLSESGSLPKKEMPQLSKEDIDRFWSNIDIKDEQECWNWESSGDRYGRFRYKGKSYKSNRISYFISTNTDPKEMEVMHSCDNTKCCNPNHLSLGTHLENMQDMSQKNRRYKTKI